MQGLAEMAQNAQKEQKKDQKLLFLVIQIGFDGLENLGYFGGGKKRRHRGRYLDTGFSMLDS